MKISTEADCYLQGVKEEKVGSGDGGNKEPERYRSS